jgi:hypothetical protein
MVNFLDGIGHARIMDHTSWTTVHDENLATYTTTLLDLLDTHLHFNIILGNDNPVINKAGAAIFKQIKFRTMVWRRC